MGADIEVFLMQRLPPKDQLIMGIHAIREVLLHAPERLLRIFTEKSKHTSPGKKELLALSEAKHIPISLIPFDLLTQMTGSESHQSFAAHVKGRPLLDVAQFLEQIEDREKVTVLMLDQIFDPQNFGALLRAAECLGASAVVWSKNRGADLTPTAAKASSGASELLPLIRISNLAEAVSQFQQGGFEAVAAVLKPEAENALSFAFAPRTLLIVGSEGEGIQPLIQKRADRLLYLPMHGKIASLNVAQTTAVLLARCCGDTP